MRLKRITLTQTPGMGGGLPNLDIDLNGFKTIEEAIEVLEKTVLILKQRTTAPKPVETPETILVAPEIFRPILRS